MIRKDQLLTIRGFETFSVKNNISQALILQLYQLLKNALESLLDYIYIYFWLKSSQIRYMLPADIKLFIIIITLWLIN